MLAVRAFETIDLQLQFAKGDFCFKLNVLVQGILAFHRDER
jgi:hypothetical protein